MNEQRRRRHGHRSLQTLGQRYLVGGTLGEVFVRIRGARARVRSVQGSFAKVKYAEHNITRQPVAIKIISRKRLTREGLCDAVDQEIAIARRLEHPNIVNIQDASLPFLTSVVDCSFPLGARDRREDLYYYGVRGRWHPV